MKYKFSINIVYNMVCYNHNKQKFQKGSGVLDSLLKVFTVERYPGERHARSLAPSTFGQPMNFMGPGTRLDIRLDANGQPLPNSTPLNSSDYESYTHNKNYKNA